MGFDARAMMSRVFWAKKYGLPVPPTWMQGYYTRSYDSKLRLLVAPVGHGKSWEASYEALYALCRDRNKRILIVSKSRDQARNDAQMISSTIERVPELRDDFGLEKSDHWGAGEFTISRDKILKEPSVTSAGLYGQIEGMRLDLILCDDVIDWENTYSEVERRKVKEWFDNTLQARLEPGGTMFVIGTRWHPEDLYAHIKVKPGWNVEEIQAVRPDGGVLWPERWDRAALEQKRLEMGETMFQLKFQNNPTVLLGGAFKQEWIRYTDTLPRFEKVVVGVDPAVTKKEVAKAEPDATALVTVGIDAQGLLYVLDIQYAYLDSNHADLIAAKCAAFPGAEAAVESNNFQKLIIRDIVDRYPTLAIWSEEHYARDKVTRILDLQPKFQQSQILFWRATPNIDKLIFEYLSFPTGKHDDGLDALELAVKRLAVPREVMGFSVEPQGRNLFGGGNRRW